MADEWSERARELGARRIERRSFLRGAAGLSALAMLDGAGLARAALRQRAALPSIPAESGLDTIVVTMMENRSLDHLFGWMGPAIDGLQAGFANPTRLAVPADLCASNFETPLPVADPTPVETYRFTTHCDTPDPDHGWNGSRIERNAGAMNGFVERSGRTAMGYYEREDIPFLGWLATGYTTFSRYFSSVLGPTYPNRLYWLSGQGGTAKGNAIPAPTPANPTPTGYTWPTIFDRLSAAGVDWAYYATDIPTIALFFHTIHEQPGRLRHITDYFADAAAGRLPQVVFCDPSFETVSNDFHPAHDIRLGERYVHDVFRALAEGPQWERSAFIMTFDEAGGFYDHVVPGRAPDLRASADHCEDWGQLGFRVPTVIASPFARRGFIGEQIYDHASILKLIEWRFGLAPLTPRDAAANNLAEVLDFESANPALPEDMPFIPIHAAGLGCSNNEIADRHEGNNPLEVVPDAPVPAPVVPATPTQRGHEDMIDVADSGYLGRFDFRERARHGVWRD